MSLQWDATAVNESTRERIMGRVGTDDERALEWAKTERIIFASMVTGLGKDWQITEASAAETFDRLSAYEHATDSPVRTIENPDGPNYPERARTVDHWLTFEDIKARIGLRTNVSPVTRAKFERKLGEILMRDAAARRVKG